LKINIELRGSQESGFILRYTNAENTSLHNKNFVFLIKDFYLSILRIIPIEKIRTKLDKLLNSNLSYPIINLKVTEHILMR